MLPGNCSSSMRYQKQQSQKRTSIPITPTTQYLHEKNGVHNIQIITAPTTYNSFPLLCHSTTAGVSGFEKSDE